VNARAIPLTVLKISFIVLAVAEENFDLTILDFVAFKPRFNYLVRQREQSPITLWSVVAPLPLVDCARRTKLTHAGAWSFTILVLAFVDVAIRVDHLTVPVSITFRDTAFIHFVLNLGKLIRNVLIKCVPVSRHLIIEHRWDSEFLGGFLARDQDALLPQLVVAVNQNIHTLLVGTFVQQLFRGKFWSAHQIDVEVLLSRHRFLHFGCFILIENLWCRPKNWWQFSAILYRRNVTIRVFLCFQRWAIAAQYCLRTIFLLLYCL